MGRGKSVSAPKYRLHKGSGQAVVKIAGKTFYLGKHGTAESQQRYRQTLADHWSKPNEAPKPVARVIGEVVTIARLAIEFAKDCQRKHGDKPEWKHQIRPVLKEIRETYGHLPAGEFGPVRLKNFRQSLVDRGLCRQVVKRKTNYVVRMFKHGVEDEYIPVEYWQRLLAVRPVEMGSSKRKKRWSVDVDLVLATQRELTPILRDMVEVQRLTGTRPSEICSIRPCDIDRTNHVWIYTPASHKTEHHGHNRIIPIGPKAQAILLKYLLRDAQAFCFTPAEAYDQHYKQRCAARTTPAHHGNRPKPRKPKSFRPKYNHNSYRRAIERAALRAFPIPDDIKDNEEKMEEWKERYVWKPNQLRKSAATEARREMGLEVAQMLLGHASKTTTERFYAEMASERAVEFAQKFG